MFTRILITISLILLLWGCNHSNEPKSTTTEKPISNIEYVLVKSYPHDTTSFTEGFLFHDGNLYESTGASQELPQTKSLFGMVDLTTGKIKTKAELDRDKYFGEGIVFLDGKVFQLTYKNQLGFVYDAKTFRKIKQFSFKNKEGWGLTTDGKYLIMSDGTHELTFLSPDTLEPVKTLSVSENGYARENLNELEYIKGYIYANIWTTNTIVKINPEDGKIIAKLDLTQLAEDAKNTYSESLEMNGIAFDSTSNTVYVTGKLWPHIYQLKID